MNEVTATTQETKALKGLMTLELQKLAKQGLTKEQALENINSRRHELSQKAFQLAKHF